MNLNQLILFDDNGIVLDVFATSSIQIDGNNVIFDNGSMNGINVNFGLLESSTVNIGETLSQDQILSISKSTKVAQLNLSCQNELFNGFDCDPVGDGTKYHFPFDTQAQDNYNQYLTDVLCGASDNEEWKVCDSNGNWMTLDLTPDQFKANVRPVASSFKKSQINQYRSLVSQVETAQSLTDIKVLVWTPSTY